MNFEKDVIRGLESDLSIVRVDCQFRKLIKRDQTIYYHLHVSFTMGKIVLV